MENVYHVAIDGPVASGKGSVAKALAKRLDIAALDTGAMYRAYGLAMDALHQSHCNKIDLAAQIIDGETHVFINGEDVTNQIRTAEAGRLAAKYATWPEARNIINNLIREIAKTQSMVVEGRDICSIVLPNAKYKFYLTSTPKVRAQRRLEQLRVDNPDLTLKDVTKQIKARDKNDRKRAVAPLKRACGAIKIDSSKLSLEETVDLFLKLMN